MFKHRSTRPERIDTGDYTPEEYATFLREIAFINRHFGDRRALRRALLDQLAARELRNFSFLDVGCGSGALLRDVAVVAASRGLDATLVGIDFNEISAATTNDLAKIHPNITTLRGDAFRLPFDDGSFDFVFSSLFLHHLPDDDIPVVLAEMSRVARLCVLVIDLHRHPLAYWLYRLMCAAFRISPLVTEDGSLSILKGFKPHELASIAGEGNVTRSFPFRLVLTIPQLQGLDNFGPSLTARRR